MATNSNVLTWDCGVVTVRQVVCTMTTNRDAVPQHCAAVAVHQVGSSRNFGAQVMRTAAIIDALLWNPVKWQCIKWHASISLNSLEQKIITNALPCHRV